MSVLMKKRHEHIMRVSQQCGLSYVVVDSIIKAYIDDLRDSMFAGNSVKIDRLVTIHVTPNGCGGYKTASAVSKTLRAALRGTDNETVDDTDAENETEITSAEESAEAGDSL